MAEFSPGFFAPVLADLLAALPSETIELPLSPAHAARDALGVRHAAHARLLPGRAEIRAVHLAGPRAEVLNLFLFPSVAAPIFAMEFVAFGKKPVVAVIDAKGHEPAGRALAARVLRAAHARHPDLPRGDDAPAWFEECRSGDDFFVRPSDLGQFTVLTSILHQVWRELLAALPAAGPATPEDAEAVQSYKDHHRAHSPGRPFLHRTFGEAWTEDFMVRCLFAPPAHPHYPVK
jgi:hypothetical protein